MENFKLAAPWTTYFRKIKALFTKDEDVKVVFDEDEIEIKLYVQKAEKAAALTDLLPAVKEFGNVDVKVTVIPANKLASKKAYQFADAFEGNPIVDHINEIEVPYMTNSICYVSFVAEVVQFFNDNLGDEHGLCSTLYADIANDVFENRDGIYFCTAPVSKAKSLGAPLGEWP